MPLSPGPPSSLASPRAVCALPCCLVSVSSPPPGSRYPSERPCLGLPASAHARGGFILAEESSAVPRARGDAIPRWPGLGFVLRLLCGGAAQTVRPRRGRSRPLLGCRQPGGVAAGAGRLRAGHLSPPVRRRPGGCWPRRQRQDWPKRLQGHEGLRRDWKRKVPFLLCLRPFGAGEPLRAAPGCASLPSPLPPCPAHPSSAGPRLLRRCPLTLLAAWRGASAASTAPELPAGLPSPFLSLSPLAAAALPQLPSLLLPLYYSGGLFFFNFFLKFSFFFFSLAP